MDGWIDRCTHGWIVRQIDTWVVDAWIDRQIDRELVSFSSARLDEASYHGL